MATKVKGIGDSYQTSEEQFFFTPSPERHDDEVSKLALIALRWQGQSHQHLYTESQLTLIEDDEECCCCCFRASIKT